jgi:succinate dehydrogenase/fumarate reductase flavoprotein subunit
MPEDRVIQTDILVVGGAMAGLYAAIKAGEAGRDVTLIDKAYAGKSGVSPFAFAHHGVFDPKVHHFDRFMNYIVRVGEYVNNRYWVETILRKSYDRYREMQSWGVPFLPSEQEAIWHKAHIPETDELGVVDHAEALVHKKWLDRMREKALETGVKILDRIMVTDLIKQDGRVAGAVGFHTRDGGFYVVRAKAVIMAAGSGGFRDGARLWYQSTADGETMSYRIGAALRGKEFGHKQVAMLKDIPMPTAAQSYSQKRVFVNAEGEEYFNKYAFGTWGTMLGALFEVHAGRGPLYFDFDRLTPVERRAAEEFVLANQKADEVDRSGISYATVSGKQEMMWCGAGNTEWGYGGICINEKCESNIPGLYAAGDSAGSNFCGSMYPGTGWGKRHRLHRRGKCRSLYRGPGETRCRR